MEDYSFDISSLLTGDEMDAAFAEKSAEAPAQEPEEKTPEIEKTENPAEEAEVHPEKVGEEEETEEDAGEHGAGPSPDAFYSSIASALKTDGIFPDFDDKDIENVKSPEDFAELMEKAVTARFDERQKRIDEALGNGVAPDTVRQYEQTLQYLASINEEALSAEGDEAEDLRRQLIYNDLINRGYSQDKANREIEKSFRSGSDIDDAKDALAALNKFYKDGYDNIQKESKAKMEAAKAAQKQNMDKFRKMVLEDEVKIGETVLDKRTSQRVYDAVSKPVWKDPETGQLLTQVQKFQKENPLEFLKQLGMWFVLTDGGKSVDGFTKEQVRTAKNRGIRELEGKINTSHIGPDGSLQYASRTGADPLLSDGWKVDTGSGNN